MLDSRAMARQGDGRAASGQEDGRAASGQDDGRAASGQDDGRALDSRVVVGLGDERAGRWQQGAAAAERLRLMAVASQDKAATLEGGGVLGQTLNFS